MTMISRRDFLRMSVLAGGALLIEACTKTATSTTVTTGASSSTSTSNAGGPMTTVSPDPDVLFEPNVRIRIDATGTVTVTGHRSEMGQGVLTAMAMIVAEELDADWSTVTVEQADADGAYGEQGTGGSTSINDSYRLLRRAGAEARSLLVAAAAMRWGVDASECATRNGQVRHDASGRSLPYGDLVADAADLDPDSRPEPVLKDPSEFNLIGTPLPLAHTEAVLDGSVKYCSDLTLPNMRYAAVAYPPTLGGSARTYEAGPALAVAGVEDVVEIPSGVAVIATSTWAAIQGRNALEVDWDPGPTADLSSKNWRAAYLERAGSDTAYDHPFYAHAPIEPMSCVVDLHQDSCEVWAPVQLPRDAQRIAAQAVGLATGDVSVHVPLSGGRFGRGLHLDYVDDAAHIARETAVPIKLVWTREDDMRRDFLHPLAVVVATSQPADPLKSIRTTRSRATGNGVRTGNWRAVEHFTDAFAHESYVDEVAATVGMDPVEARLEMLDSRAAETVRVAARESGWGDPLPAGWGRGIAYHSTWGETRVSQVAEVSVTGSEIRVHRVVCAVDCGIVINPDTVRAQIEGGIVFGLTAALKNGIDIEDGRVVQTNYHDYPILRFDEMPVVEVHIIDSPEDPSGIGEMGVSPIAPAVANAVFNATGQRIRSLPLRLRA